MYKIILNIVKNLNEAEKGISHEIEMLKFMKRHPLDYSKRNLPTIEKRLAFLTHFQAVLPQLLDIINPLVEEGISILEESGQSCFREYVDGIIHSKMNSIALADYAFAKKRVERFDKVSHKTTGMIGNINLKKVK